MKNAKHCTVGKQTIITSDCLSGMRQLADGSIDVIVTSPPYNIGMRYGTYLDRKPEHEYLEWLILIGLEFYCVMHDGASLFLNVGGTSRDPWLPMRVAQIFHDLGFVMQNDIAWVKSISIGDDTVGHFKPIQSPRYLNNTHEKIFHFTKTGNVPLDRLAIGRPYKDKGNLKRGKNPKADKRCAGNAWFEPYETIRSKNDKCNHPASYPVGLAARCLALHGEKDLRVLDPFVGIGSTLIACEQLGHRGIGFEIDNDYAASAIARLTDFCKLRKT